MINELIINKPDDMHLHLREGEILGFVLKDTARQFARAIVMPNLSPPVKTVKQALDYRREIVSALPQSSDFNPLMTLYLTDNTTRQDIINASIEEHVYAVKLYPAGATTNSESGVTNLSNVYSALEQMQKEGVPLLVHGEVTQDDIDIFDREAIFIETVLMPLLAKFPELKVVLEHITTKDSVDFVSSSQSTIGATITAHHLLANRNHMLVGGIKPHYYCLPVLKRKAPHQDALIAAATSGSPKFFLGTDSAPHYQNEKESACGCAGIFSAHAAIELYADAFEKANKLDMLEGFASNYGADFYGLKRNTEIITLEKRPWMVPKSYSFSDSKVIPFLAEEQLSWRLML